MMIYFIFAFKFIFKSFLFHLFYFILIFTIKIIQTTPKILNKFNLNRKKETVYVRWQLNKQLIGVTTDF